MGSKRERSPAQSSAFNRGPAGLNDPKSSLRQGLAPCATDAMGRECSVSPRTAAADPATHTSRQQGLASPARHRSAPRYRSCPRDPADETNELFPLVGTEYEVPVHDPDRQWSPATGNEAWAIRRRWRMGAGSRQASAMYHRRIYGWLPCPLVFAARLHKSLPLDAARHRSSQPIKGDQTRNRAKSVNKAAMRAKIKGSERIARTADCREAFNKFDWLQVIRKSLLKRVQTCTTLKSP